MRNLSNESDDESNDDGLRDYESIVREEAASARIARPEDQKAEDPEKRRRNVERQRGLRQLDRNLTDHTRPGWVKYAFHLWIHLSIPFLPYTTYSGDRSIQGHIYGRHAVSRLASPSVWTLRGLFTTLLLFLPSHVLGFTFYRRHTYLISEQAQNRYHPLLAAIFIYASLSLLPCALHFISFCSFFLAGIRRFPSVSYIPSNSSFTAFVF